MVGFIVVFFKQAFKKNASVFYWVVFLQ